MSNFQQLSERTNELREAAGEIPAIGWMFDEVAMFVYSLVKLYQPTLVVQTGHLWGKSAVAVLEALTDGAFIENVPQNADKEFSSFVTDRLEVYRPSTLISVDPYRGPGVDKLLEWYQDHFHFYQMPSSQYFESITRGAKTKTMGIVDGDHSDAGCRNDIIGMAGIGANLIIVDDTEWLPSLDNVTYHAASDLGYKHLNLPYFNGIGILVR